jgi:hypothetical protein
MEGRRTIAGKPLQAPRPSKFLLARGDAMMEFIVETRLLFVVLLMLLGSTGCGKSSAPEARSVAGSTSTAKAELLQIPGELAGKTPIAQGLAYIDIVNELQAEYSSPPERHFRVKAGGNFWARGWAFDDKRKKTPPVWLELVSASGGKPLFIAAERATSEGLAEAFHYPWANMARFAALGGGANIPPGNYEAFIFQADSDVVVKTPFYGVQRITITFE